MCWFLQAAALKAATEAAAPSAPSGAQPIPAPNRGAQATRGRRGRSAAKSQASPGARGGNGGTRLTRAAARAAAADLPDPAKDEPAAPAGGVDVDGDFMMGQSPPASESEEHPDDMSEEDAVLGDVLLEVGGSAS